MTPAAILLLLQLGCAGDGDALEQLDKLCAADPQSTACWVLTDDYRRACPALDDD